MLLPVNPRGAVLRLGRLRVRARESREALALPALGVLVGVCAGLVSIAFRGLIELLQFALLADGGYEGLSAPFRFGLPIAGVVLTIALTLLIARRAIPTGVVHVIERLEAGSGRLPTRNALLQFVTAPVLLAFGLSMGREGPAIHVGAASGSLIAQRLGITDSAARTLLGCGVAGAIGAAFNTPLAGVILTVEVVLMEYTVGGFAPILLAAVSGATLGRLVYGDAPAFAVPDVVFGSLRELPWITLMGLAIGAYAAAFITLSRTLLRAGRNVPWWAALLAAGALVGAIGAFVPHVMGVGYDVVERTIKGGYAFGTVALLAAAKLVATALGVGGRVPAGLIGPTLVMGSACGALFGLVGTELVPIGTSNVAFYVMLGMGAMMGATLQAPLSALVAVLELTGNPNVILPGILAIASAALATRHMFDCVSIFQMQREEMNAATPAVSAADARKE